MYQRLLTYCLLLIFSNTTLLAQDCNASFYIEENPDCINCFHFTNTSSTNINSNISFLWDMGDGNTFYSENVSYQFPSPDTYTISLSIKVPICTGILQISAEGGTPPYSFSWSNGYIESSDSLSIQDSLCPGNYHITITDALNNTSIQNIVMENVEGGELNLNLEWGNCLSEYPDSCIGYISANVEGGTPPYTYSWSNSSEESSISNLCAGTYSLTVCDANNTCKSQSLSLPVYECGISSWIAPTDESSCNGHIYFEINGGTFPYSYNWSPNVSVTEGNYHSMSDTNLCSGTYIIEAIDSENNTCIDEITIAPLQISLETIQQTTNNSCNGSAIVNVAFGNPPYNIEWENGSNDSIATDLCNGWYHLTVCDANQQCITDSIEITNLPLTNNINWRGPSGIEACDGYIYVYTTGGNPVYNYSWEPSISSLDGNDFTLLNDLCNGTYILTTCDATDNCITDTLKLTDKPFNVNFNFTNPKNGICSGKINANVIGSSPPYNFMWSNGEECLYQTECTIYDLCEGTYYVTICDFENNCAVDSVSLYDLPEGPKIISRNIILAEPETACNASAIIEAQGQEPLQYSWSTNFWQEENLSGIENQCSGTYYLTICDVNNICIVDSVQLFPLEGNFSDIQQPYNNLCNGSLKIQANGGFPPYSFIWDTGQNIDSITGLCQGWHYVTVSDYYNNLYIDSIEISNLTIPPLHSSYLGLQPASISGYCTDESTQSISTDYYTSIRGNVYLGNSLLPEGVMVLFTKENEDWTASKLCKIVNGSYRIEQLQTSEYYAFAIPIFSPGEEYYPVYFPSYYGDVRQWQEAQSITLLDTIPKDIHLIKSEIIKHGLNNIKGNLIYTDNSSYEENIFLPNWYLFDPPGIPQVGLARHIPVSLLSSEGELLKYQLTDNNGEFDFQHMDDGEYKLHFEKANLEMQYSTHSTDNMEESITYVIDSHSIHLIITGNNINTINQNINIFPNPVISECYVKMPEHYSGEIRISICDMSGRVLIDKQALINKNISPKLDLKNLKSGMYIFKIQNSDFIYETKLMKK